MINLESECELNLLRLFLLTMALTMTIISPGPPQKHIKARQVSPSFSPSQQTVTHRRLITSCASYLRFPRRLHSTLLHNSCSCAARLPLLAMIYSVSASHASASMIRDNAHPADGPYAPSGASTPVDTACTGAAQPVDQSTAQCCHCGYRNSHASNCPFKG